MMKAQLVILAVLLKAGMAVAQQGAASQPPQASSAEPSPLVRQYKEGEKLHYHMKTSNRSRESNLLYEIDADGVVKKDAGGYFEEFSWSNLMVNGKPLALPPASQELRQVLSLVPNPRLGMPDLSKVHPMLIGPITDMLTFYADMLIAKYHASLQRAGDHSYFTHGTPNSWADGSYVILGQDSIDFDVTLAEIDQASHTATVVVRHVPPEKPQIKIPVEWMNAPVADTPNNWVQISKAGQGRFSAQVGKETFVATIKVGLNDGRIVSATLANPVEILERICTNEALTSCGDPSRFQILRQVEIR